MNTKEILSGTEDQLLAFFKQKYNLIENVNTVTPETSATVQLPPTDLPTKPVMKGAAVGNKVSTGFSGLFDGTSWGKQ